MATTLLNGVNDVLKKLSVISGDAQALTTLTDPAKQVTVDAVVMKINEAIDELYERSRVSRPKGAATSTVTLADATREYDLPADLVQVRFPLVDQTNGNWLEEYPGGYDQMWRDQLQPDNYTGQPTFAAINPVNGKLRMDTTPSAFEAGRAYELLYDKDTSLSLATDEMPFSDAVWRALRDTVAQLARRQLQNDYDDAVANRGFARASKLLRQTERPASWGARGPVPVGFDPYNA